MEKIRITTFTDPMMGLSYECEPMFRKLETHFPGRIEFRYVMSLLVKDVRDFMTWEERALPPAEGIRKYNARLAGIYKSEESITGMPICMEGFRLFDEDHTTSLPLNLAYKAAQLAAPEKADRFLYNLRYATIVETCPTTHLDETLKVVRNTGIDEKAFLTHYQDGSAQESLDADLQLGRRLGIRSLPTYLLEYGDKTILFQTFDYEDFVAAIWEISSGEIVPQNVSPSTDALRTLLRVHPLISSIEIREAFDLGDTDEVQSLLEPLIRSGEISNRQFTCGWFVAAT